MFSNLQSQANLPNKTMTEDKLNGFRSHSLLPQAIKHQPNQSFSFEQKCISRGEANHSIVNQNKSDSGSSLNHAETPPAIKKTMQIQCEMGSTFFEHLDYRVCLRCGLNDRIMAESCNFHPFKCKSRGGTGKYLYSSEWHKCREHCKQDSPENNGCITLTQHYYGSHLPYQPDGKRSPSRTLKANTLGQIKCTGVNSSTGDKEVMTEVSLLFNPFKSSSGRTPTKNSQLMSLQSQRSASRSAHSKSRRDKSQSSNNKYRRDGASSPLTASQLNISSKPERSSSRFKSNQSPANKQSNRDCSPNTIRLSRLRVSPTKDNKDVYIHSQRAALQSQSKLDSYIDQHFCTESARAGESLQGLSNRYLNTISNKDQQRESYNSKSSVLDQLERSQKERGKVEDFLKMSQLRK